MGVAIEIQKYDVIIAGAGPAGSTAGCLLSSLGYRVLIIDKCKFPREKLCGGLTTHKTIKLLSRIFNETDSTLREKKILNYTSQNYDLRYKKRLLFRNTKEMLFYFVDREIYDSFLLKKAEEAGAHVLQGEKVIECNMEEIEIETSGGKRFKARFIIAADGVNSIIRRRFPQKLFNKKKWKRNLISGFEIFVKRNEMEEGLIGRDLDRPILFLSLVKWGFAWMFPRSDRVVLGLGGLFCKNRGNLLKLFYRFLLDHGISEPKRYKIRSHNIPCGYYMTRPVYNNVILVGDAGGYVDPLLGEGIFYAQRTAELASWAIHRNITEGISLDKMYRKLLWKYVLPEFFNAKVARFFGFYISEKLSHYPARIIFKLMSGILQETLHGTRTNRGMIRRESVFEEVSL